MSEEEKRIVELWDLPEKVCIRVNDNYRNRFFIKLINSKGSIKNLINLLKIKNLNFNRIYTYRIGKYSMSLDFIKRILNLLPENERDKIRREIQTNVIEIKLNKKANPITNPKLPIKFSPILARIAGHIVGDGGIRTDFILRYTNPCNFLLNQFEKDILTTLGKVKLSSYRHVNSKQTKTIVFPGIVGLICRKMFGAQRKKQKHVPKIVLISDKDSKAQFLKGLFDDEGYVSVDARTISFKMANKNIVETIKEMLKEFDIKTGKIYRIKGTKTQRSRYGFYISSKNNLEKFRDRIGFDNPIQKGRLNNLLSKYWK